MAEMVSMRVQTSRQSKGQAAHDFNDRPKYADPKKLGLNKTIYGGTVQEVKAKIASQSRSIISAYNEIAEANRDEYRTNRYRRQIGSWRKTTATHKTAIITFSSEVRIRDCKKRIDRDALDKCALNFFENLCKYNHCELTYIVRHDDEATPHYHAMFTNVRDYIDENTNTRVIKPLKFEMRHLSELQDRVGSCFSKMGMRRGIHRNERLDVARNNNMRAADEDINDYEKRIYKLANVTYRKVSKLHEDLPKEIAEKEEQVWELDAEIREEWDDLAKLRADKDFLYKEINSLQGEYDQITNKHKKMASLIEKAEVKLQATNSEDVAVTAKIEKNMGVYNRRKQNADLELAQKKEQINAKKQELESLTITPIKGDITRVYEVVTNKGVLKNTTENMNLVDPKEYTVRVNNLMAHSKKNMSDHQERERVISARESSLERNENRALTRTKQLNGLEQSIPEKIRIGINNYIESESTKIVNQIKTMVKAHLQTEKSITDDDIDKYMGEHFRMK